MKDERSELIDLTGPSSSLARPPNNPRLRHNNFDLLRFTFAFVVFLVHAHVLSGAPQLSVLSQCLSSELAVKSFFVVSGFLIFMSYENSGDIRGYFIKRARRIYPAYLFVIVFCVAVGGAVSSYAVGDYFSSQMLKYLAANLFFLNFLHPNLPGVFEGNSLQAVNGALWTLKIEVLFYFSVPLMVLAFRKYGRLSAMIFLYLCSMVYAMAMEAMAVRAGHEFYLELQRQLPGQLVFFIAGAAGYYYLDSLVKYARWLVPLAIVSFVFQSWLPWVAIQPVALAVLVISFACLLPVLGNFDRYGDFSYGIYIVHFPILQLLISQGYFRESPWMGLFFAGVLVMISAFMLWHLVEKPFLRKSSHYVAANRG